MKERRETYIHIYLIIGLGVVASAVPHPGYHQKSPYMLTATRVSFCLRTFFGDRSRLAHAWGRLEVLGS